MQKAFYFALISAFSFSLMNLVVKLLGQGMPAAEITFFRGLIGTVAVLAVMAYKKIPFSKRDRGLLMMRGLFGGMGTFCNFLALSYMKIADVAIIFQLSGIFVLIFSTWILHEPLPKGAGKWLLLIFGAVMLMVNPWQYSSFSFYALFAIAGAMFSAAAYTTIRRISLSGAHSSYEIMFYFLFTSMLVGAFFTGTENFVVPDTSQSVLIMALGMISVFAQFFLTGSFIATNAVVAQFLQYIGVFFNAFWGFVVFAESLSWITIGAGLVMFICSVMLARLKEQRA